MEAAPFKGIDPTRITEVTKSYALSHLLTFLAVWRLRQDLAAELCDWRIRQGWPRMKCWTS